MRAYRVFAIERGTVIDHIPAGRALKVFDLLRLDVHESIVTVGMNLDSKRLGKKDILKIENRLLAKKETDLVGLLAPTATINIIEASDVVEKRGISLPELISGIMRCPNPNCITNVEKIEPVFHLESREPRVALRCHYCEVVTENDPELFF